MEDESQEDQGLKEVLASEILAKIEKGELVKYDHVIVKGDLDLSNSNLLQKDDRKLVTGKIEITDSLIRANWISATCTSKILLILVKRDSSKKLFFKEPPLSVALSFRGQGSNNQPFLKRLCTALPIGMREL